VLPFANLDTIWAHSYSRSYGQFNSEVSATMSDDCLFCKIIAGEIPANKVYADDDVYAFHDISPAAPIHILVIPKKHVAAVKDADGADAELLGRLLLRAGDIAREQGLAADGYRFVINTGNHGGQTVFHLHLHILGGRRMSWPPG
jgi:histidine triad (HIT) family protein